MEPIAFAIGAVGLIPVIMECAEIAFAIRMMCRNISFGFQEKVDRLCKEIVSLESKLAQVKDANPKSTTLLQHVNDLKTELEKFKKELQDLVPKKLCKRTINHNNINNKLNEILEMVARCDSSFVVRAF
ncbi:hypothetical protein FRC03_005761 [Tulasnella sp. 419]|nr:hypothetical protein FRC03_005761 [Tulasnella sp. 419]